MAYSEFSVRTVQTRFGLTTDESSDLFGTVPPLPVPPLLRQVLDEWASDAMAVNTEKSRSEGIIAPVLKAAAKLAPPPVRVFSGTTFDVDRDAELTGVCDFLLSLSPAQSVVEAPAVVVVAAKNDDIKSGLGQCLATMVAAQRFNDREGRPLPHVYGLVTTGSLWKYLRLTGVAVALDPNDYPVADLDRVLGVLAHMLAPQEG